MNDVGAGIVLHELDEVSVTVDERKRARVVREHAGLHEADSELDGFGGLKPQDYRTPQAVIFLFSDPRPGARAGQFVTIGPGDRPALDEEDVADLLVGARSDIGDGSHVG